MTLEYQDQTGEIIGAAIEVHKQLGPGFIESIYEKALSVELRHRAIPFQRQLTVPVLYRGVEVGLHRLDLLVLGDIVVELKAVKDISAPTVPTHTSSAPRTSIVISALNPLPPTSIPISNSPRRSSFAF